MKKTWSHFLDMSNSPISCPPSKTLTAELSKYWGIFFASREEVEGECSEGLMIAVLPAAMAPTRGSRARPE